MIIDILPHVKMFLTFFSCFFHINLHQDNIGADLPYTGQVDHKFFLLSKNAKEFAGTWHNNMADAALTQIKDHILHIPQ